ncbi:MAG: methyltransferase domain-containing protein [Patescibacteria group bacterium]
MNRNIKKLTIRAYDAIAKTYSKQNKGYDFWSNELEDILNLLDNLYTKKQRINFLDLGCGSAGVARVIVEKGITYTGIDLSTSMLDIARKEFPKATFLKMDVTCLKFKKQSFDIIWASAILLHLDYFDLVKTLSEIKRVLKTHGLVFISMEKRKKKELKESIKLSKKEGKEIKRYFALYSKTEFSTILKANGFRILKFVNKPELHSDKEWLCFFCSKDSNC